MFERLVGLGDGLAGLLAEDGEAAAAAFLAELVLVIALVGGREQAPSQCGDGIGLASLRDIRIERDQGPAACLSYP
jgi:hypothetical protein